MFTRPLVIVLIACLAPIASIKASVVTDLLPRPQNVQVDEGNFAFEPDRLRFVIGTPSKAGGQALADRLRESLDRLDVTVGLKAIGIEESKGYRLGAGLDQVAQGPDLVTLPDQAQSEGYQLVVNQSGLLIRAATEQGLFYGIQTLEQLVNRMLVKGESGLPCLRIMDWPSLRIRGFHEDYGRDQLPTVEDHKRSIRFLAHFKMNTYAWYIEPDHFVYEFDPTIGQDHDRFTFEEIRELVAYAKQYHVEIIPVAQLFGHMEMILAHPRYRHLAEVPGRAKGLMATSLDPVCDQAFEFVRKLVGEIAPAFDSEYFHCGLDETRSLGLGRSAAAIQKHGMARVLADYYIRLHNLLKSHGKKMIMYSDIVLKYDDVIDMLPKDIIMMYWNYSPIEHHDRFARLHEAGYSIIALSSLIDWKTYYPPFHRQMPNIDGLVLQAIDLGAMGHLTSSWGDPVHGVSGVNFSEVNTYGVAYSGAVSWKPRPMEISEFSPPFALQYYGSASPDLAKALTLLAEYQDGKLSRDHSIFGRYYFQIEPRYAARQLRSASEEKLTFLHRLQEEMAVVIDILESASPSCNADYLRVVELCARILQFSADNALLCRSLAENIEKADFDAEQYAKAFDELALRHELLWKEYRAAYLATNRPINVGYIEKNWQWMCRILTETAGQLRSGMFSL